MNIYVSNLSSDVTGSDLREVFESFGRVETADVVRRRPSDESRGFGFVGMPARSEGVRAVLGVHGRNLKGRVITASEVRPRDPVSGACHTRCSCRNAESATERAHPMWAASIRERSANARTNTDWSKITRARGLIQSSFYRDPEICSVLPDRCPTFILLDTTTLDREGRTAGVATSSQCSSTEQA